jgi:predicted AlkP superfamily phosphohydrolase/phosphomutase
MAVWLTRIVLLCTALTVCFGCGQDDSARAKRVLILGVDGLDPKLLQQFMDADYLPNFRRLIAQGDFKPLGTTMPPLSPVAWSTFISGLDAGGHGIFDFIHRDPQTLLPRLATSMTVPPSWSLALGSWNIPLAGGKIEQLRQGKAFWQVLEEHGIPTQVFKMPANFPPVPSPGKSFSGMGTPDVRGTPGTFSLYTTHPPGNAEDMAGGQVFKIAVEDHRVNAQLVGPDNPFRRVRTESDGFRQPKMTVDFAVFLDPTQPVAKFVVQEHEFVLNEGEWSDWMRVDFEAVPFLVGISAVARFYLQEVRPHFRLYVTPLQINPEDPAMPISTPEEWSRELWKEVGYFYTQELPEDSKAFSGGVFQGREFWTQAKFVLQESRRALDYLLQDFREGLLFFYFSSVDQGSHMLWRYFDPDHPAFIHDAYLRDGIRMLYQEMDNVLGHVMRSIDEQTTLIVMSDHGFAPFYWGVNLNSWLLEKGYVKLKEPVKPGQSPRFPEVDWSKTKAYALGLNGVYVNLYGRERRGIVWPGAEYEEVLDQLEADLLALRDSRNGQPVVTLVTRTHRDLQGEHVEGGPDMIVGYNRGYRSSWKSPLGEFPPEIFVNNDDAWSGDHSMDYRLVPGVLITNQRVTLDRPALYDLTVAILDEYGIPKLSEMIGRDCLAPKNK